MYVEDSFANPIVGHTFPTSRPLMQNPLHVNCSCQLMVVLAGIIRRGDLGHLNESTATLP